MTRWMVGCLLVAGCSGDGKDPGSEGEETSDSSDTAVVDTDTETDSTTETDTTPEPTFDLPTGEYGAQITITAPAEYAGSYFVKELDSDFSTFEPTSPTFFSTHQNLTSEPFFLVTLADIPSVVGSSACADGIRLQFGDQANVYTWGFGTSTCSVSVVTYEIDGDVEGTFSGTLSEVSANGLGDLVIEGSFRGRLGE